MSNLLKQGSDGLWYDQSTVRWYRSDWDKIRSGGGRGHKVELLIQTKTQRLCSFTQPSGDRVFYTGSNTGTTLTRVKTGPGRFIEELLQEHGAILGVE